MSVKLFFGALLKFLLGVLLVGLLIFIPAGTFAFFRGWLLMGVLFIPMFCVGILMIFKNPELLKKRLNAKEKEKEQNLVVKLSGLMFIFGFALAGFNFRFNWYSLPKAVSYISAIVFLLGYILYAEVLRENTYLSRTITVEENQKVIKNGLYGIIRHPMYFATLILFLSIPLILGSIYAFFVFLAYPFIIAKRIKNEENLLKKELAGYKKYTLQVKYRLIPFIW